jgi:uncharacterized protein (DUF433 family)
MPVFAGTLVAECSQIMDKPVGRFVVVNPKVCHGKPTFRGTRILVADVLEQVASGMAWEAIVDEWEGRISAAAIAESVGLAESDNMIPS